MRGQGRQARTRRALAAAAVAGFAVLATAVPAGAQTPTVPPGETSGGVGLFTSGLINLSSPNVSCPPSPQTAAGVDLSSPTGAIPLPLLPPSLVSAQALYANCGTPSATSSNAGALSANVLGIGLGLIESQCRSGVGTSSVVRLGAGPGGTDLVVSGPSSINVPNILGLGSIATINFNETTTDPNGETVQNAVRVTLLGTTQSVVIGQARCRAGAPDPVIPEAPVALLLPLSAVALFGGAFLVLRRRSSAAA